MVAWVVKLFEFGLVYEQQKAIKAQVLTNFVVEMTKPKGELTNLSEWTLYVDSLLNRKRNGAEVILEGLNDMTLEYSLKFNFQLIKKPSRI